MAETPRGFTFDATASASLTSDTTTAKNDANTAAAAANAKIAAITNAEDEATKQAQSTTSFVGASSGVTYSKGARGWSEDAAAAASASASSATSATQSALNAASSGASVASMLVAASVGTVYYAHTSLPAATGSGDRAWVTVGSVGSPYPGVWTDTTNTGDATGWEPSVRFPILDDNGNLLLP